MRNDAADGGTGFLLLASVEETPEMLGLILFGYGLFLPLAGADGRLWLAGGARNRLITAATGMALTGPPVGYAPLRTNADPTGTEVIGAVNNCAGSLTPWGRLPDALGRPSRLLHGCAAPRHREAVNYERYGVSDGTYA